MNQAFYPANILLPRKGTDMSKWSVVACDQFTSEPEYWEDVEKLVGDMPSTLRLILPEVFLESDEEEKRLAEIRNAMDEYMSEDLFTEYPDAMIYIERTDSSGKVRAGIVGAVDLEQYDYHKGSTSLIRATEGTIIERIPPRIRVRSNAPMELPHIMILIDDKKKTVVEKMGEQISQMELLYDFDLMKSGGHLKGWLISKELQKQVLSALDVLAESDRVRRSAHVSDKISGTELDKTYEEYREEKDSNAGDASEDLLLFAMGDGNHSLATAKEFYEQLKAAHPQEDMSSHPARFALAEIVNLHSPALEFEAIHRIMTNVNSDHLLHHMIKELGLVKTDGCRSDVEQDVSDSDSQVSVCDSSTERGQCFTVVIKGQEEHMEITKPSSKLTVGSLQNFLDKYIKEHRKEGIKLDYIHGRDNLKALTCQTDSIGFILPDMGKEELFPTVKADGALPRKTFSMGHAEDKRYYTECRRIR